MVGNSSDSESALMTGTTKEIEVLFVANLSAVVICNHIEGVDALFNVILDKVLGPR